MHKILYFIAIAPLAGIAIYAFAAFLTRCRACGSWRTKTYDRRYDYKNDSFRVVTECLDIDCGVKHVARIPAGLRSTEPVPDDRYRL